MLTARTSKTDPGEAAEDLLNQIGSFRTKLGIMYASRDRDHLALNRAIRERLPPGTPFLGASSAGEIDNDGLHFGSVVLTTLGGDVEVGIGLGTKLSEDGVRAGVDAVTDAAGQLGHRPEDLNPRTDVGIVIDDGYRRRKEALLFGVLEKNPALFLVGGGASDPERDPSKRSALVHANDRVETDAAAVVLLRTESPFRVLRSHWYVPSGQILRITRVDDTHKRALRIDGAPAARRYAEALGVSVDELGGNPRLFSSRPTALRVGREYFIHAPSMVLPDGSILFEHLLDEGTEYEVMSPGDPLEITRRFLDEQVPRRVPSPRGMLVFHSSERYASAEASGHLGALSGMFRSKMPIAGFNVEAEIYCGFSVNNTLATLVFGSDD